MATMKKPIAKAQNGVKKKVVSPTYKNLPMARSYKNQANGIDSNTPATRRDSTDYKIGFIKGVKGQKPSAQRLRYEGEGEYEKMGRWEGQNAVKKKKNGGAVKAKNGKSFPDLNKDGKITKADVLKGRGVIAKSGAALKKQAAIAISMKKAGKTPMKKAMMGAMAKPMMKSGGKMAKCKYGCN